MKKTLIIAILALFSINNPAEAHRRSHMRRGHRFGNPSESNYQPSGQDMYDNGNNESRPPFDNSGSESSFPTESNYPTSNNDDNQGGLAVDVPINYGDSSEYDDPTGSNGSTSNDSSNPYSNPNNDDNQGGPAVDIPINYGDSSEYNDPTGSNGSSNPTSTSTSTSAASNSDTNTNTNSNSNTSTGSTTTSTSSSSTSSSTFASDCLSYQNPFREAVGVPDLVWSDELAAGAQEWADNMAAQSHMYHSHLSGVGENVAMGTTRTHTLQQLFELWTNEKQYFIVGAKFPDCTTGGDVGHYTQIVWKKTVQVGCGVGKNSDNSYLCCRYLPPGNYINEYVY